MTLIDTQPVLQPRKVGSNRSPQRAGPPTIEGRVRIRLLSYNILFGQRWPEIRDLIRRVDPDVICLQEVPADDYPLPVITPAAAILRDFPWPHACHILWTDGPRRVANMTLVRDDGEHRGDLGPSRILAVGGQQPYAISNVVTCRGSRFEVVNVHLTPMLGPPLLAFPFSEVLRFREALHLNRHADGAATPVVAAGDFNSFRGAPACLALFRRWADCRARRKSGSFGTRATYGIPFVIDHVLLRGDARAEGYEVLDCAASDHRPIVTEISVPTGE